MEIRLTKAITEDLPHLLSICKAAAATEGSTWDHNYPNSEILSEDIRSGALYRIETDGNVIGLLSLGETGELDMLSDPSDGTHPFDFARFGIHPDYQGKGAGHKALTAAITLCREKGGSAVRVLASPGNPAALSVYRKAGFVKMRLVHLWEHDYWYLRKSFPAMTYDL